MDNKIINSFFSLDKELWYRNKSVFLPSDGAMRSWLCKNRTAQLLVLLPDQRQARTFYNDFVSLNEGEQIGILPEIPFIEDKEKIHAITVARGSILLNFKKTSGLLVATPTAMLSPFENTESFFNIKLGEEIGRDTLISWLIENKYTRSDIVWSQGQYIARGSIVDIFSPSCDYPVRIEFFDNEIFSIRLFRKETQKSIKTLTTFSIQSLISTSNKVTLDKYFKEDMKVIFFNPKDIENAVENAKWLWNNLDVELQNVIPYLDWIEVHKILSKYNRIRVVQETLNISQKIQIREIPFKKISLDDFDVFIQPFLDEGYNISIFTENKINIEWAQNRGYRYENKRLSKGFIDPVEKKIFLSDHELIALDLQDQALFAELPQEWQSEFELEQWVVHDDYGIGKYHGMKNVATPDGEQEYIVLEYAEKQRLLLPVQYFYKISPWTSISGKLPVANSLKGTRWKKSKERAYEHAKKIASDLVRIYAERELTVGHSFSINNEFMKNVADSFPYTETKDQTKAIREVLADMKAKSPMDRLIVGDVGFGKTEIAIRAIAAAVFDGKQAVLLAPTTLLAQQHYDTIKTRFINLPIKVAMISRFISLSEQKRIINDLYNGDIDVIIGTHRLLSKDILFNDLGLVIIDEEHRFGVAHKEYLKKMAPTVDVLMLSATPIPRSLSLSISGLRDISLLETPPQRRLPVITVVREVSDELIISAILREKNRGGQVFFIHNKIFNIQTKAKKLKKMFPKLRIEVVHSKTPENALEKTMHMFTSGEIDVLISTTIVESGLDIPNANTLIVNNAHELGLAQIYQLRGRVGRSEEQAFAFLFYPNEGLLSKTARERLEAIIELDELGAGYNLARRDLQIRGSGDIFGIAQHGNSIKIGNEKYYEILSDEIQKIKGTYMSPIEIKIMFPAIIPSDYLPQERLRVILYRRLIKVNTFEEVAELENETRDRYGRIPLSLRFLFNLAYVRCVGGEYGISKIICKREETIIYGKYNKLWESLSLLKTWSIRAEGLIAEGGYNGIASLLEIIKKDKKLND